MTKIISAILTVIIGLWIIRLVLKIIGGLIGVGFSILILLALIYILNRIWKGFN